MLKTTVLPKVTISSAEVTRQRTEIALMSYDRNVHQIKIPTDLTAGEIAKILVIFTFPFDESVIQLNGAWVDGHIQFTLPEILRTQRGGFYIEVNIDLTDSQITFARYRAKVVKSDIDANASQATTVYFELFEDLVNEVADNAQQAKDVINLQNVDVEGHANTSKQTMDSDVNSVHDYSVSATTTIDAKVNTIEQAKTDAIQNIDDKVELVETTKKTALTGINEQVESVESAKGLAIDSINDEKTLAVNVVVQAGILAVGDVGAAQGSAIGAMTESAQLVNTTKESAIQQILANVDAIDELEIVKLANDIETAFWQSSVYTAQVDQRLLQSERLLTDLNGISGVITLTNTQDYPFNNSGATIPIAIPKNNLHYRVDAYVVNATGGFVEQIVIYDKQVNGFKIRFDGSAKNIDLRYQVVGGMYK